jgi:hypothetical protein
VSGGVGVVGGAVLTLLEALRALSHGIVIGVAAWRVTLIVEGHESVAYRGGFWGFKPPRNSEVLTKPNRIPSSVEYTFVIT